MLLKAVRLISSSLWIATAVKALAPLTIKGAKLFDEHGEQFFVKGKSISIPHSLLASNKILPKREINWP